MSVNSEDYMLTTVDNPWNPFSNWDEWYAYDRAMGYHTPSLLARVAASSIELSEADQELIRQEAIEEIIKEDLLGIYQKISEDGKVAI